ncbi:MAG TPA: Crp/Fnr family transcriptional regulator [Micrococcales bacterium]|nr:Crp/Fnr family transcriptional regulator [Micrococcales bacterium]
MTATNVRRGDVLFREGEQGDRFWVILAGKVKLGHTAVDGRESLLAVLGPGEIVGELSVYDPGPRTATATILAPTTFLELEHTRFVRLLEEHPALGRQLLRSLAQRLRRTNSALADLVFSDVPGRVAKALLDLAARFGRPVSNGVRVPHDLTQEELAQLVGASRETVNKSLAEFSSRGWIQLDGRAVVLLDLQRLEKRAR